MVEILQAPKDNAITIWDTCNVCEIIILGDISSLSSIDQKSPKFGTFQITLLSAILNLVKLHKYTIFHNVIFIRQSILIKFFSDFSAQGYNNNKYYTLLESYDHKELQRCIILVIIMSLSLEIRNEHMSVLCLINVTL